MKALLLASLGAYFVGAAGCGSPCQQVKATRCNAQILELCGSNSRWQRAIDCAAIQRVPGKPGAWRCDSNASAAACVEVK